MRCHDTKRISYQIDHFHTCWDCKNDQTCSSPKKQHCTLGFLPAKALNKRVAAKASRKLRNAKDKLRQVDVQAKVSYIQTDSIVDQTDYKPVEGTKQTDDQTLENNAPYCMVYKI